jgi:hypothetical protein
MERCFPNHKKPAAGHFGAKFGFAPKNERADIYIGKGSASNSSFV